MLKKNPLRLFAVVARHAATIFMCAFSMTLFAASTATLNNFCPADLVEPEDLLPVITTLSAKNINETSVTLNGRLLTGGDNVTTWFVFARDGDYLDDCSEPYNNYTGTRVFAGINAEGENFDATVSGLTSGTIYSYKACAKNSSGIAKGTTSRFTTANSNTAINCDESFLGGKEGITVTVFNETGRTMFIVFNAFSYPDQLKIYSQNGSSLGSTAGFVSGEHEFSIASSYKAVKFQVTASHTSTAWNLTTDCGASN